MSPDNAAQPASRDSDRIPRLRSQAALLPSVETSLDDFIARANELPPEVSFFDAEAEALRVQTAQLRMREGVAREESLRRELDSLRGKLAEAEAHAAIGGTGGSVAEPDGADTPDSIAERVRIAEATAAKAIAAAKAASLGLTVSQADIAAIERGLVVPADPRPKRTSWRVILGSLLVGGAVAVAGTLVFLDARASGSVEAAPAAPLPAPAVVAPQRATTKPVEVPAPAAAAVQPAPAAVAPAPIEAKPTPTPAEATPAKVTPPKRARPKKKEIAAPSIEGDSDAAPEPSPADSKPSGGIVDPF
jgi:hypothetical protein